MSQSQHTAAERPALGARENWWGEDDADDAEAGEQDADEVTGCISTKDIAEWKAHSILRSTAPKHSPIAKHGAPDRGLAPAMAWLFRDEDNVELIEDHDPTAIHTERCTVEMTEPMIHVPNRYDGGQFGSFDYGQRRHRSRYDPEHGYVTGPLLGDRPEEEFLELMEIVLANAKAEHSFSDEKIDTWLRDARRMKRSPNYCDEEALTRILEEMYDGIDDRGTAE